MQNFQEDWYSTDTGMENFTLWWCLSVSLPKIAAPLTKRSHQPYMVSWKVASTAMHSAWHFIHGLGQFTWNDISSTRISHSWADEDPCGVAKCHFQPWFSINVWCGVLDNNLIGPHVIEWCLTALYYGNFLENELPLQ
jgi:hypothetical protein